MGVDASGRGTPFSSHKPLELQEGNLGVLSVQTPLWENWVIKGVGYYRMVKNWSFGLQRVLLCCVTFGKLLNLSFSLLFLPPRWEL